MPPDPETMRAALWRAVGLTARDLRQRPRVAHILNRTSAEQEIGRLLDAARMVSVQTLAGHADAATTMGIYAHAQSNLLRPVVEAAEQARKRG